MVFTMLNVGRRLRLGVKLAMHKLSEPSKAL